MLEVNSVLIFVGILRTKKTKTDSVEEDVSNNVCTGVVADGLGLGDFDGGPDVRASAGDRVPRAFVHTTQ